MWVVRWCGQSGWDWARGRDLAGTFRVLGLLLTPAGTQRGPLNPLPMGVSRGLVFFWVFSYPPESVAGRFHSITLSCTSISRHFRVSSHIIDIAWWYNSLHIFNLLSILIKWCLFLIYIQLVKVFIYFPLLLKLVFPFEAPALFSLLWLVTIQSCWSVRPSLVQGFRCGFSTIASNDLMKSHIFLQDLNFHFAVDLYITDMLIKNCA